MTYYPTVRLDDTIERGSKAITNFSTRIAEFSSGKEVRNANWSEFRREYDISYGVDEYDELQNVIDTYIEMRGPLHTFTFKDWSDFNCINQQPIETGGTDEYQIVKYYGTVNTYQRLIHAIELSTLQVFADAVLVDPSDYVATAAGIITFDPGIITTETVTVTCEFNVIVRFSDDRFEVSMDSYNIASLPEIKLIEVI